MDPSDFNATSTLDNDNTSIISRERNNYRRCLLATTFIALLGLTNILLLFLSITIRLQGIHTGISLLTITSPILRFLSIECHKGISGTDIPTLTNLKSVLIWLLHHPVLL